MITLYSSPSCLSCRKVKKYFVENNIKFVEKNIFQTKLLRKDIFRMLANSESGFEDIISTKSKVFKEANIDLNALTIHQLTDFIIEHPSVLKRPIMVSDIDLQVGYNPDDISLFLPKELRDRDCEECTKAGKTCEYLANLKIE